MCGMGQQQDRLRFPSPGSLLSASAPSGQQILTNNIRIDSAQFLYSLTELIVKK